MIATRLCLVRHGETAWNAEARIQGQLDVPLNATGVSQARAAGGALVAERFDAIYSSDLSRARQTAEAIAQRLHLPIRFEARLRERHYGDFQNHTYEEIRARYPADYVRFKHREEDWPLPGGESLRGFAQRAMAAVEAIAAAHAEAQVLVVTHGGVLDVVYRRATGRPLSAPRDFQISNAALNWIDVVGGEWSVAVWGERAHLIQIRDELA